MTSVESALTDFLSGPFLMLGPDMALDQHALFFPGGFQLVFKFRDIVFVLIHHA